MDNPGKEPYEGKTFTVTSVWKNKVLVMSLVFDSKWLTQFWLVILENSGCCRRGGWEWRSNGEPENASLVQTAVVVVQVAGVQASVHGLQLGDGQ